MVDAIGEHQETWIAPATPLLLCSLWVRPSHLRALALTDAADAPASGRDVIRIIGKGEKERLCPDPARDTVSHRALRRPCAVYAGTGYAPYVSRRKSGPSHQPRIIQLAIARLRMNINCPATATPHACVTRLRRISFQPERSPPNPGAARHASLFHDAGLYGSRPAHNFSASTTHPTRALSSPSASSALRSAWCLK